jgi:hypothetical protein
MLLPSASVAAGVSPNVAPGCPLHCPPPPPPPPPIIPVAVTTCACANEAALRSAAGTYLAQWIYQAPPGYGAIINGDNSPEGKVGTRLIVISTSVPISGIYYYSYSNGAFSLLSVNPETDAAAVANDELLLARSIKMTKLTLTTGQNIQGVDPIDLISGWLQSRLIMTDTGTSLWHAIATLNLPQVTYATFKDPVTGDSFTVYSGETITVYDSNGWSIQLTYTPSVAGAPWQIVPGSVRDNNGNKVDMVNNVPTTPEVSAGSPVLAASISVAGGISWNPITVTPWQETLPKGSATVEPYPGGGSIHDVPTNDGN